MALEMLILLLENPSDDSVEMAVDFCKEVREGGSSTLLISGQGDVLLV